MNPSIINIIPIFTTFTLISYLNPITLSKRRICISLTITPANIVYILCKNTIIFYFLTFIILILTPKILRCIYTISCPSVLHCNTIITTSRTSFINYIFNNINFIRIITNNNIINLIIKQKNPYNYQYNNDNKQPPYKTLFHKLTNNNLFKYVS